MSSDGFSLMIDNIMSMTVFIDLQDNDYQSSCTYKL